VYFVGIKGLKIRNLFFKMTMYGMLVCITRGESVNQASLLTKSSVITQYKLFFVFVFLQGNTSSTDVMQF